MFVIVQKCYSSDSQKPYWSCIEEQFNTYNEAWKYLLQAVDSELACLNEEGTPNYNHFTANFDKERCDCVIEFWEKEINFPNDNCSRPVTKYYIVEK